MLHGFQKGTVGMTAPLGIRSHLEISIPFLLCTVHILIPTHLVLCAGFKEHLCQWVARGLIADHQPSGSAVKWLAEALIVLRAFEQGQDVVIGPPLVAQVAPVVVVSAVTAHVDHGIHQTCTAKPAPPGQENPAIVELDLRHRAVAPVQFAVHQIHVKCGNSDGHLVRLRAGFEQRDVGTCLRQPCGDDGPGRSGAHNDVICCFRHQSPPSRDFRKDTFRAKLCTESLSRLRFPADRKTSGIAAGFRVN